MNNHTPTMDKIVEAFEKDKKQFEAMFGLKFNYYPQSIRKMEEKLNEMYSFGREVGPQVAVMLGIYLGECIRRNIKNAKAEWSELNQYAFETALKIKLKSPVYMHGQEINEFELKPMLRVDKFLNDDRTDSIWAMYCMAMDMAAGRINLNQENVWQQAPRGYSYRTFTAQS